RIGFFVFSAWCVAGDFIVSAGDFCGGMGDFDDCVGDSMVSMGDFMVSMGDFGGCAGDFMMMEGDFGGCMGRLVDKQNLIDKITSTKIPNAKVGDFISLLLCV